MSLFPHPDRFERRHIGPSETETQEMLKVLKVKSLDELIEQTVPASIRLKAPLRLPPAQSEFEYLQDLKKAALQNRVMRSYIGMGYSGTITPPVILRNLFSNPGWYTQYTPYQAEIAQGRLESLLNFQTMICDLTGMPIANASLLDEGTAAAEAMNMFYQEKNKRAKDGEEAKEFFVSDTVLPQTIDILKTRALPHGIDLKIGNWKSFEFSEKTFGVMLQYPDSQGNVLDYRAFVEKAKAKGVFVCVGADLLSLALLTPPGEPGRFLMNPFGLHYTEVRASNLIKTDAQGRLHSASDWPLNPAGITFHGAIHEHRSEAHCVMHVHTTATMAVCCLEEGLSYTNFYAAQLYGKVAYHAFEGITVHDDERARILASAADKPVLLMRNHGPVTIGFSLAHAFSLMWTLQRACEVQLASLSMGRVRTIPEPVLPACVRDALQFNPRLGAGQDAFDALQRLVDKLDPSYRD